MRLSLRGETVKVDFVLTPEEIEVSVGTRTFSLETLKQPVEQPTGRGGIPARYSWSGILVGRARTRRGSRHLSRERWQNPETIDERLRAWVTSGRKLRLVATDTRIRGPVFIANYRSTIAGGHGDIRYSIELVEWRNLNVNRKGKGSGKGGDTKGGKGNKRDKGRADQKKGAKKSESSKGDRKTYTVKSGDTLSSIAKKFLGSVTRWREIYQIPRNRKTIGPNPDAISPGMVLVIPEE